MAKKTPEQLAAQQAAAAYKQAIKNQKAYEKQQRDEVKAFLASNPDLSKRLGVKNWGQWRPASMDELRSQYSQYFNPDYEQPSIGTYGDPNTGEQVFLKASTPEVQAVADIYKKAYEDWRAANKGKYGALYTREEMKKYLPKGFKDPGISWQKSKELGLDVYDQTGTIIPRSMLAPSGLGDAISRGQYVPPNVMASAMGAPQSEINRLIGITSGLGTDYWNTVSGRQRLGIFGNLLKPPATPPSGATPPAGITPPGGTTTASSNVATAAANLANAAKPTVPQFIQPYGRPKGSGAYGEKDINW